MGAMPPKEVADVLTVLGEAYNKPAWHGPNLRGSLRGVDAQKAAWRPKPGRHNIWEEVVHAAFWKHAIGARIIGEPKVSFPFKGRNWFKRPQDKSEKAWRADVALLDEMHQKLTAAIAGLSAEQLDQPINGSKSIARRLINGIIFHDIYHAGQIQLLKKLLKDSKSR
jgi:hypothetical protein